MQEQTKRVLGLVQGALAAAHAMVGEQAAFKLREAELASIIATLDQSEPDMQHLEQQAAAMGVEREAGARADLEQASAALMQVYVTCGGL